MVMTSKRYTKIIPLYIKTGCIFRLTHEAGGIGGISAHLAVNLDQTLHDNFGHLSAVQSVLETVSQEDQQRQRLAQLVWTGRWTWGENTAQFVQHPCLGCG